MTDGEHAWYFVAGLFTGLLLAAGYAAWITRHIHAVIKEAREVVAEMRKIIGKGWALATHVSNEYAPLKTRVDELERKVEALAKYNNRRDSGPEEDD